VKTVKLTNGKVALVDDADFERVSQFKWCAHRVRKNWYAVRGVAKAGTASGRGLQRMHQFLMPGVLRVDHADGDGLNNQRSTNLRAATNSQNMANQGISTQNTSGVKGVYWAKHAGKWRAKIKVSYRSIHLGYFEIIEEAARAYESAAVHYFGEFGRAA
jgi:hypothetical protein